MAIIMSATLMLASCTRGTENSIETEGMSQVENSKMQARHSIASDENVIAYFKNQKNFINQNEDREEIFILAEEGIEGNQERFYSALNTNEAEYHQYIETQRSLSTYIEEAYHLNELDTEVRAEILLPIIAEIYPEVIAETNSDCKGVYFAKLALNASVAYGAHVACLVADVTVIVGALCHSAVLVGQIAANYIALDEYKTCIKPKDD